MGFRRGRDMGRGAVAGIHSSKLWVVVEGEAKSRIEDSSCLQPARRARCLIQHYQLQDITSPWFPCGVSRGQAVGLYKGLIRKDLLLKPGLNLL